MLLAAVIGTYSRGALIGLAAAAIPCAVHLRRHWRLQLLIVVVALGLAGRSTIGDRIDNSFVALDFPAPTAKTDVSTLGRLDEMRLAIEMFTANVWGGLGPGGYAERFQQYSSRYHAIQRHEDRQAHSLPLEIAAEGGLILLIAFLVLCALMARNAIDAWRIAKRIGPEYSALVAGAGLAMASYLAASLFLHADFSRLFWLLRNDPRAASLRWSSCRRRWRRGRASHSPLAL